MAGGAASHERKKAGLCLFVLGLLCRAIASAFSGDSGKGACSRLTFARWQKLARHGVA